MVVAKESVHNAAAQLYDAVLLYAYAVKSAVDAEDDPRNGVKLYSHMLNVSSNPRIILLSFANYQE